jgi:hypothetical protein
VQHQVLVSEPPRGTHEWRIAHNVIVERDWEVDVQVDEIGRVVERHQILDLFGPDDVCSLRLPECD